jgi:hypothetical protein
MRGNAEMQTPGKVMPLHLNLLVLACSCLVTLLPSASAQSCQAHFFLPSLLNDLRLATQDLMNKCPAENEYPIVKSEFIFDEAPFPSAHASTIAEVKTGFVSAWFGGTHEKSPDVGIWVSRLIP